MHLRRALLLFAIVLGLAAVAASISRPTNVDDEPQPTTTESQAPSAGPGPGRGEPIMVAFDAGTPHNKQMPAGHAATVVVDVEAAGMVEIPRLGVSVAAEPVTPARFDILPSEPGRYEIRFEPADGDTSRAAGTLIVKPDET